MKVEASDYSKILLRGRVPSHRQKRVATEVQRSCDYLFAFLCFREFIIIVIFFL